jgi:flagellar hook-associated protein 3 FlgL
MRVTENRLLQVNRQAANNAREEIAKATQQLSSGREIDRPSDDPARWAQAKAAQARMDLSQGQQRSLTRSLERMQQTDAALQGFSDTLARIQELATQGANGTLGSLDRMGIANEVGVLRDNLIAFANARSSDGEYLLGGSLSATAPFDATGLYLGDGNVRQVVAGENRTVAGSVTGEIFTAASGIDVFALVESLRLDLAANNQAGVIGRIDSINAAVSQVASARTLVGTRMVSLDTAEQARADLEESLNQEFDRAIAVDPLDAATRLQKAATALDAARTVAARVSELIR